MILNVIPQNSAVIKLKSRVYEEKIDNYTHRSLGFLLGIQLGILLGIVQLGFKAYLLQLLIA